MPTESLQLPVPTAAAAAQSAALVRRISAEIERCGGWIRFDRYMQMALYEPVLGYYSAASEKLGARGDFTTAPSSDLLSQAIAAWGERLFAALDTPVILELGAGSGALAEHLLEALAARGRTHVRYLILEPSASLRADQQERLEKFTGQVTWLERLPSAPIEGLILANEVADALPCVRFVKSASGVLPLGVAATYGRFRWQIGRPDPELTSAVAALEARLGEPLPHGYRTEICLVLGAWLGTLADLLARGALLLIDYGLPRRELYHDERSDGTLICHYRHRAHGDPFALPGLQDISAWVDFSACADAARAAGLVVEGYTTQAHFLLGAGAQVASTPDARGIAARNAAKMLLLPGAMGERFKALLLTRGLDSCPLPGRDLRSRL
jgi:SAM-dependent MidA family methyltransferase